MPRTPRDSLAATEEAAEEEPRSGSAGGTCGGRAVPTFLPRKGGGSPQCSRPYAERTLSGAAPVREAPRARPRPAAVKVSPSASRSSSAETIASPRRGSWEHPPSLLPAEAV